MRGSRHENMQVGAGIYVGCLDVLTVFTDERVRVDGGTQACAHDAGFPAFWSVVVPSVGRWSRRSRRACEAGHLAAMTESRPQHKTCRDGIVTPVKTTRFDGDAA